MQSQRYLLPFALSLAASFAQAQEAPQQPGYIRYRPAAVPGEADLLETAISRFDQGGQIIDLVAVAHLADRAYFEKLNAHLAGYDAVLYEMAGGPYTREKAQHQAQIPEGNPGGGAGQPLAQIGALQTMVGKLLALSFQLDHIDYLAPHFIHADLDAAELARLSPDGSAGLSPLLARAMTLAQNGKLQGLPTNEGEANQLMMNMMTAVMAGDGSALKRALAPILAQSEVFLKALEEGEESVLISKRNEVVIEKIKSLPHQSSGRMAVLYGAGHMPDLERRLLLLGYRKTQTDWHAAWTIEAGPTTRPQEADLRQLTGKLGDLLQSLGKEAAKQKE